MSLEVFYRPNNKFTVKVDAKDMEDIFKQVGRLQEVFEACECGKCQSTEIKMVHRVADGYDFYELVCTKCNAKLSLGNSKEQGLFPRRYKQDPKDAKKPLLDENGRKVWLPDGGWQKWDHKKGEYV